MPNKPTKAIPVAILVRVSTSKQETSRQVSELKQYAKSKGYAVVEVCQETISGQANDDDRHGLRRVEDLAAAGKIKKVLVHEISRIARRNSVAISSLKHSRSMAFRFTGTPRESKRSCLTESAILPPASCSHSSLKWRAVSTSC